MSKWWKASTWGASLIAPVEVVNTTERQVEVQFVGSTGKPYTRRRLKQSSGEGFFETWDEAHAFLMQIAEARLQSARRVLQVEQGFHGNVKGMKKPEGA